MLVLYTFLTFAYFFKIMFVFNQCTVILLGTCLTYCFRVTVSAVSSLVGPAHRLICCYLCWCDIFEQINLIWFENKQFKNRKLPYFCMALEWFHIHNVEFKLQTHWSNKQNNSTDALMSKVVPSTAQYD